MRTEWLVIFIVSSAGTVLGGVLINMVPAGRPRAEIISQGSGGPGAMTAERRAEEQLRKLEDLRVARLVGARDQGQSQQSGVRRPRLAAAPESYDVATRQPSAGRYRVGPPPPPRNGYWLSDPAEPTPRADRPHATRTAGRLQSPQPDHVPTRNRNPRQSEAGSRSELAAAVNSAPSIPDPTPEPVYEPLSEADSTDRPHPNLRDDEDWQTRPRPDGVPAYRLLHVAKEFRSERVYAELLFPGLGPDLEPADLKRIAKAIAEFEGFDSMTLYTTLDAREAHYSMEFADAHPQALEGLLGTYERGWFKTYKAR